jgi:hypothetical protein
MFLYRLETFVLVISILGYTYSPRLHGATCNTQPYSQGPQI